jgi:hypothetical protein
MANKAKSTQLRKLEVSTTAAGVFTKIGQLSDTNFATGSAQFLDATNYDSGRKEYIAGLDDVQDMTIQFQRVVDDEGQNQVRDACFANPRTTLYFKGTTGQGEVMTFTSECGGWQVTGGANSVEMGQVTVRPRDIVWKGPEAPQGGG